MMLSALVTLEPNQSSPACSVATMACSAFSLWNPTTNVRLILPDVDVDRTPGLESYKVIGFRYSNSSKEYKVVIIFCMFVSGSGKLVNGKLHFAMIPPFGREVWWDIVYIDLDSETDGIIEQPEYGNGHFVPVESSIALGVLGGSSIALGVLGGCLCVLCNGCDQQDLRNADLWILKEYGVKESWTRLLTIRFFVEVRKFMDWNPLFMLPTGEILVVRDSRLAVYNSRYNTWTYPKFRNVQSFREMYIHVESLVSPLLNAD